MDRRELATVRNVHFYDSVHDIEELIKEKGKTIFFKSQKDNNWDKYRGYEIGSLIIIECFNAKAIKDEILQLRFLLDELDMDYMLSKNNNCVRL